MKAPYIFTLLTIALFSCQAESSEELQGLENLKKQRSDLKTEYQVLGEKIKELDDKIRAETGDENIRISKVKTVSAAQQPFVHYFKVQGQVEAEKDILLTAETSGLVKTIYVKEGQKVQAGQKILSLDTDILDKNIEEALSGFDLASFVYERQKRLWDQNIGSELEFKQAKNNKLSFEARLSSLNAQKEKSIVRAPFSGVIDEIKPKVGELVNPGLPIGRLINLDLLKLDADMPENYLGKVSSGTPTLINFPAIDLQVESKISQVSNFIDPNNRTIRVSAKLPKQSSKLLPNLVAELNIQDYANENAIVVPTRAILQDLDNRNFVYILQEDGDMQSVTRVFVETGYSYQGQTEIADGLAGTEQVVVDGARNITEGSVVRVEN